MILSNNCPWVSFINPGSIPFDYFLVNITKSFIPSSRRKVSMILVIRTVPPVYRGHCPSDNLDSVFDKISLLLSSFLIQNRHSRE